MRILLADDQPRVRFALRTLLERQPGLEVVGEAHSGQDLRDQIDPAQPDLVLLDWELPGERALDTLSSLRTTYPTLRVIALSGRSEARQAALQAGVDAFVSKSDPPERLLSAIRDAGPRARNARRAYGANKSC
jgi:two-component system invasion response regulator UvrY